jgi:hypothetical protein
MAAVSRTDRVCTKFCAIPKPLSPRLGPYETRPREALRPMQPQWLAGMRSDPPMSEPWAMGTIPAATAAAAPPLEPPAEWPSLRGVDVLP